MVSDDDVIFGGSIRSEIVIEVGLRHVPTLWYVPIGTGPWPILCFLHGVGEHSDAANGSDTSSLDKLLRHGSPAWHAHTGSRLTLGFVVVCPQLERRRRWGGDGPNLDMIDADTRLIDELVKMAVRDNRGDPERIFLTGFSTGGEGALQMSQTSENLWSAIWAVDPALQREPQPEPPAMPTRLWIHHGSDEPFATLSENFGQRHGLKLPGESANYPRVLTRSDTNHVTTCKVAYADARVYKWLLQGIRSSE